jgi:DNA-binding sugar fermentation-stimulating protein
MKKKWSMAVVQAIGDSLTAYLTLQARCGLAPAYSEYLLYDPIVRVCRYRGWNIECEVKAPRKSPKGDFPRIDFRFHKSKKPGPSVLVEVKYQPKATGKVKISKDVEKLRSLLKQERAGSQAFVVVAGRKKRITKDSVAEFNLSHELEPYYKTTYLAAHTTFGVTAYEVNIDP